MICFYVAWLCLCGFVFFFFLILVICYLYFTARNSIADVLRHDRMNCGWCFCRWYGTDVYLYKNVSQVRSRFKAKLSRGEEIRNRVRSEEGVWMWICVRECEKGCELRGVSACWLRLEVSEGILLWLYLFGGERGGREERREYGWRRRWRWRKRGEVN